MAERLAALQAERDAARQQLHDAAKRFEAEAEREEMTARNRNLTTYQVDLARGRAEAFREAAAWLRKGE